VEQAGFPTPGADFEFDSQEITVTVPASFDAAAQRLTLLAAAEAGFPETTRLLEEPQATFYCWLEHTILQQTLGASCPTTTTKTHRVLVVDIGGVPRISAYSNCARGRPQLCPGNQARGSERPHLLGGDNVDLADRTPSRTRLIGERGKLSGTQWDDLVARCRDLKEKALLQRRPAGRAFPISLPGRGVGLVAAVRTAQLTRAEVQAVLLDGFFPSATRRRILTHTGRPEEWGLPYASIVRSLGTLPISCGVVRVLTRYCSMGGSLHPVLLRQRICQQSGNGRGAGRRSRWKRGARPRCCARRGAIWKIPFIARRNASRRVPPARFSSKCLGSGRLRLLRGLGPRLSVFTLVASSEQRRHHGLPLKVHTNRLARFQAHYSTRHDRSKAGDIVDWSEEEFHALPPLETIIKVADSAPGTTTNTLPVTLIASANE